MYHSGLSTPQSVVICICGQLWLSVKVSAHRCFVVEVRAVLTCVYRDKHFECSKKLHWFRKTAVVRSHLRSATSLAPSSCLGFWYQP